MRLNELRDKVAGTATSKGFRTRFPNDIGLMHSELSEALEEYRNGQPLSRIYREASLGGSVSLLVDWDEMTPPDFKPLGAPIEIADTLIRILHRCGVDEVDVEASVESLLVSENWVSATGMERPMTLEWLCKEVGGPEIALAASCEPDFFPALITERHRELTRAYDAWEVGQKEKVALCFARCIVGLVCTAGVFGMDLPRAVRVKAAYNETRPHKHGGKLL